MKKEKTYTGLALFIFFLGIAVPLLIAYWDDIHNFFCGSEDYLLDDEDNEDDEGDM